MKYANIREEELKNKVAHDYFAKFDSTKIVGNIDFCISVPDAGAQIPLFEVRAFLWAEAKKGKADVIKSLVQLILTIGKARTFDKFHPPAFLGAFDAEKIAFIPYSEIHDIFYVSDFNWNVAPSNHETKEFKLVYEKVKTTIEGSSPLFTFGSDDAEIKSFVKDNFVIGKDDTSKLRIDKNNFIVVYNKWLATVKPTIAVNWDVAKKIGIIDGDFYLADLLASENETLKEKLFVLLKRDHYELDRKVTQAGMFSSTTASFTDKQKAHTQFWNKYERPPREEYWDYIVERRDLLVPQDVRERKGSFFTPQIWVELSQQYIAGVLGENWQEEYYVWDCAAGTGNLLAGLTNKYNIWASTLDQQDVEVMRDRIENGANLLKEHVFQFDFLNDDFAKLPQSLREIVTDPEKRKKLVIYINPPYAEVASKAVKGKVGVNQTAVHEKYGSVLGTAGRELYTQFFVRIYAELSGSILAEFSKLKALQGSAFEKFRKFFKAKLAKCFVVRANTFDNVKGNFPIGFKIWDTSVQTEFSKIKADVIDDQGRVVGRKSFYSYSKGRYINKWISAHKATNNNSIGFMDGINGNDFQHNNIVYILNTKDQLPNPRGIWVNWENLIAASIYLAVRKCIEATWLNDRDQFLFPNKKWEHDAEFQTDCLTYTLFSNNIQSQHGVNHWIPFTEKEVNAGDKFSSHFMTDFIAGTLKQNGTQHPITPPRTTPLQFSDEAKAVFAAGRKLWTYYHATPNCNVNASFYDIREFFQGRNAKGTMNARSDDETYTALIGDLRTQLKLLAQKIEPKVYEYGFLKR
ncbi:MAG: hypothetical protein ACRC46_13660 [Thermoguttaceae bacterium]